MCTGKEFECELATMLENLPQNRPLYKDSGRWQIRSDNMDEVTFEQDVNESFFDFIKRVYEVDNSFMSAFADDENEFQSCSDCDGHSLKK